MRSLLMVGALLAASLVAGCGGIPVPTVRAYHNNVGRAYLRYLDKDASLNAGQKATRAQLVHSMERLLKEAETKKVAAPTPPN